MKIIENKYYHTYNRIIKRSKNRQLLAEVKTERHHIIPRSLGGTDNIDNIAILTLREHWICHRLLVKFLKGKTDIRKMYNALFIMAVKDYRTVNNRIYEYIKENIVPWNKGLSGLKGHPCHETTKKYLSKLYKGKSRPQSHRDAMKAGIAKNNPNGRKPWNYGKTGLKQKTRKVTLQSPDGVKMTYSGLRVACKENNLPETAMSSVRTGKLKSYNGWTIVYSE